MTMTITEMLQAQRSGTLTSRALVQQFLAAAEENKRLNAISEINPEAFAEAGALDASKDKSAALHGIPVLIKDNIDVAGMVTGAGSLALTRNVASADADIVRLLRTAGAVILGKTNMTEFANYMADDMPNGYSSRGGQVLNLFDPEADPSGSSTGSAVAVGAGLCAAAVGTETCGSIISPAQYAGVIGIKPTAGLISGRGILPISFTLDTAGPMARCADDARILLGVLAGKQYDTPAPGMHGLRVGICRMFTDEMDAPDWLEANEGLVAVMEACGAQCIELPEHNIRVGEFLSTIMRHEFKFGVNRYLRSMNNPAIPQSLAEIIAYNERYTDTALRYGQGGLIKAENTPGTLAEPEYLAALEARGQAIRDFDAMFDEHGIDLFFMTAAGSGLAAATGFPSMTVPIGRTARGMPIGSFYVARRMREDVLLRAAAAVERVIRK